MNHQLTCEENLLLKICSTPFENQNVKNEECLFDNIIGDKLTELAKRGRVCGTAFKNISDYPELEHFIDNETLGVLKEEYILTKESGEKYVAEIRRLNQIFMSNRLKVVCLKGCSIALSVYKDLGIRKFSDIDLLVNPEEAMLVHRILLDNGYTPYHEGVMLADDNLSIVSSLINAQSHLLEYSKDSIYLEMHQPFHSHVYDLTDVYRKAYFNEDFGFFTPQLLDLFIHSCIHAWEHYPTNLHRLNYGSPRILLYLDIMQSFKMLAQTYKENVWEVIKNRFDELKVPVKCRDMIEVTEILFNTGLFLPYCEPNRKKFDWVSSRVCSFVEQRILNSSDEYERLRSMYSAYVQQHPRFITCNEKGKKSEIYKFDSRLEDDGTFWGRQYFEKVKDAEVLYSFSWDKDNLYYDFDIKYDDELLFFDNNNFSQYENLLKISFGDKREDHPTNVYIQPKTNHVMTTYIKNCDNPYAGAADFAEHFESNAKREMVRENNMKLSGKISMWILPPNVLQNKRVYVNFSLLFVNYQQRQSYTLEGGLGAQTIDCSNYPILVLESNDIGGEM